MAKPSAGGFNVRVESLAAPMYREAIRQRRCLILADGFYEWRAEAKHKQPFLLQRSDRRPFAFGGIWAEMLLPNGELVPSAAILTTSPRGVAAEVHGPYAGDLAGRRFSPAGSIRTRATRTCSSQKRTRCSSCPSPIW